MGASWEVCAFVSHIYLPSSSGSPYPDIFFLTSFSSLSSLCIIFSNSSIFIFLLFYKNFIIKHSLYYNTYFTKK
ncbi:hypothetical protein FUSPEROL_00116 [Fusobacterium periodonticum ATCC 33693]|uniref:Uncharacterized protein n=1 Tax=Fusobacterium periodonticum ATCC 33693 TaxID=546275 RepID=D4CRV8_9FUSO|nr:hypothetical protein FUSPEROL_00116 [Fusobacterium periodonticum ATCC 33693]